MSSSHESLDPVVLIHGAWAGSWVWERLLPALEGAGLTYCAVDLPGSGSDTIAPADVTFESYLERIQTVIDGLSTPASLVAHSGGGNVASAFAERRPDLVSRIVYIAGIMLPDGLSFLDIVNQAVPSHPQAVGVNPATRYSADGTVSHVPPEAAIAHFFNDVPAAEAREAAGRLTPQGEGGRAVTMHVTPEKFGRIPRLYVEAIDDRSVILPVQRLMQRLSPGARTISLPTGHVPQLSAPGLVAQAILPFLIASRASLAAR